MTYVVPSPLVTEASAVARFLLRDQPRRLAHVEAAGRRAARVAERLSGRLDGELVVTAALLHDIGYSPDIARSGFHPLDGALYLARTDWPESVVRLVAHHSHAVITAPFHGVADHLSLIAPIDGLEADVLAYADLRAGRRGTGTSVAERLGEMRARQAHSKVPLEVRESRYALLRESALRVQAALDGVQDLTSRHAPGHHWWQHRNGAAAS